MFQTWESDDNRDGKYDSLNLKVEMPLKHDEEIVAATVMLLFDVKLHVRVKYILLISFFIYLANIVFPHFRGSPQSS